MPSVDERPSADMLFSRLTVPVSSATEAEAAIEAPPSLEREQRITAAGQTLHNLAADTDVDEEVIDRLIGDADEGLRKLEGDGPGASLGDSEIYGLEAVIETDGSRPVLFVQDGTIALDAPELQGSLARRWFSAASSFHAPIGKVAAAVGVVQLPNFEKRRIGTAFAIAPGYVVTNRHVLEEIATFDDGKWRWRYDAEVDFAGEHEREAERRFPMLEVAHFGPNPINRTVNFGNLDLAVIHLGEGESEFPEPLSCESSVDRVKVGSGPKPAVYVMGFPAKPWLAAGSPDEGAPRAGHEYQDVLERLFANRFGSKRWAPGLVEAGAGQLAGDARKWVMSHDASTLGGSSGSCVIDFSETGERVVGLHFGGRPRVENYAHVVAALQSDLDSNIANMVWA